MTVGELIAELAKYDAAAEVAVYVDGSDFTADAPVRAVRQSKPANGSLNTQGYIEPEEGFRFGVWKSGPVYLMANEWVQ